MGAGGSARAALSKATRVATEIFWAQYPTPFFRFYFETFSGENPNNKAEAGGSGDSAAATTRCCCRSTRPTRSRLLHLWLPLTVYKYYSVKSDTLITMGPNTGKYATDFACNIVSGGFVCGAKKTIPHKRSYSCSTSTSSVTCVTARAHATCTRQL